MKNIICVSRPELRWDVICFHLPWIIAIGFLFIWLLVPYGEIFQLKSCTFLGFFGYPCPFCGFSRAFRAISAGNLSYALNNCPLSIPIFIIMTGLFFWNLAGLMFNLKLIPGLFFKEVFARIRFLLPGIITGLFLLNWAFRLYLGLV